MFLSRNITWIFIIIVTSEMIAVMKTTLSENSVFREVWEDISNISLSNTREGFSNEFNITPDILDFIPELKTQQNYGEFYSQRLRTYFVAPTSGEYRFESTCLNSCSVWLSTNQNPSNATRVLNYHEEGSEALKPVIGTPVYMYQDTIHYIECQHKAGEGDKDFLSIAVRLPSGITEIPILAKHFQKQLTSVSGYSCTKQGDERYPDFVDCVSKSTAAKIEEYYDDLQEILKKVQNNSDIPVDSTLKNAAELQDKLLEEMNKEEGLTNHSVGTSHFVQSVETLGVAIADKMTENSQPVVQLRRNLALRIEVFDNKFSFPNYSNPVFQQEKWSTTDVITVFHNESDQSVSRRSFGVLYQNLEKIISKESPVITLGNSNVTGERYKLNSRVIGCSLSPPLCFTCNMSTTDVIVSLTHVEKQDSLGVCAFMNFTESGISWSTEGCHVIPEQSNSSQTVCRCTHLTNFAVLMQVNHVEIPAKHVLILDIITYIGCSLSLVGLILTAAALLFLPGLLSAQRNIIHLHLAVSMALAEIVFLCGMQATTNQSGCVAVAALVQYFFLVAFGCMLVEGVYLYVMVVKVFGTGNFTVWPFIGLAWGIPVLIVSLSVGVSLQHYGNSERCWLSAESGAVWAFAAPVLFVIVVNTLLLFWVIGEVLRAQAYTEGQATKVNTARTGAKSTIILLPLLGVTWVFGLLTINQGTLVFQYLFAIFNSLQGFFVFIFHCFLNTEVQKAFKRKHHVWSSRITLFTQARNKSSYVQEESNGTKSSNRERSEKKEESKEHQPFVTDGSFCTTTDETETKETDKKKIGKNADATTTVTIKKPLRKGGRKSYSLNASYQRNRASDLTNQRHELRKKTAPNNGNETAGHKGDAKKEHIGCTACHARKTLEKSAKKPHCSDKCTRFDDLSKTRTRVGPQPLPAEVKLEITESSE